MKIGRYETGAEIGSGSTSTVYLAKDGDETVAVKVLHRHLSRDPVIRERFRREVEIARTLEHPGIVAVYDLVSDDDLDAAVMEYCDGGSLADREVKEPGEWIRILREAAEALAFAHAHGIVHRDLKPRNLLFSGGETGGDRVKLCDFGSAHVQNLVGITTSTMFIGTPQYVPPESVSRGPSDPRWDLYSLGAVAYQMVTGVSHTGPTLASLFRPKAASTPPKELNPLVPAWLSDLILRLLGPVAERPSGARALVGLLDAAASAPRTAEKPCLFCGRPMPEDMPVCLSCGRREPEIRRSPDADAESIVLTKIPEHARAMDHFFRVLRTVSGNPSLSFSFITEDARMYSRAEKKQSIQLPVRIIDGLSPSTVDELIPVIEGGFDTDKSAGKIGLKRYPVSRALRRIKRGPLITPKELPPGSGAGAGFLEKAAHDIVPDEAALPAVPSDGKAAVRETPKESLYASYLTAAYRLIRAGGDAALVGEATALAERVRAVTDRLSLIEESLSSVSLGEIYGDIQRLQVRIDSSTDADETDSLTRLLAERKAVCEDLLEQERLHSKLSGEVLETIRRLEELAGQIATDGGAKERSAKELARILLELG